MNLKLGRNAIIIIAYVVIIIFFSINRMNDISKSVITDGVVVGHKEWGNKTFPEDSEIAPVINFYHDSELIVFTAPRNIKIEPGSKVKVIYRKSNPYKAQLYNFFGYWLNAVIFTLLPIIIVSAFVFTFVGKSDKVLFSFGKVKLINPHYSCD